MEENLSKTIREIQKEIKEVADSIESATKHLKELNEKHSELANKLWKLKQQHKKITKPIKESKEERVAQWIRDNIKVGDIVKISASGPTLKKVMGIGKDMITMGDCPKDGCTIRHNKFNPGVSNIIIHDEELFKNAQPCFNVYTYVSTNIIGIFVESPDNPKKLILKSIRKDIIK